MSVLEILVPDLPESVVDASIATWHKKPGDKVNLDEVLVEIETDKVIIEIPAISEGILENIVKDQGSIVKAHQVIGFLNTIVNSNDNIEKQNHQKIDQQNNQDKKEHVEDNKLIQETNDIFSPSIRRFIAEHDIDISQMQSCIGNKQITIEDIKTYLNNKLETETKTIVQNNINLDRIEKRVPMTRMRKRIAERLIDAKNSTAMLTTFNEVNMQSVINTRKKYGDLFEKGHGVRLGFMSFYVKAVIEALKQYPEINAFIDSDDVIYHNYFDINIAISTPRGLVTPVIRNADQMNMADIEKKIIELAAKGRDGKLKVEDLTGGNFTITNGGVFGSLMSTPIINPPQSAILGIHVIKDRPMALKGETIILPMMYIALSYDHRLIDGRESIGYLVKVKEGLEDPIRLLLNL
ncbi:dihydrolipoyllysine-residue succinyltransferase [Candidatus Pantoea edessiphila]|uniref:Dihydrolipoyllysine-residue succinyltransferase n=1 Tax=Candidatus Pantoea edessiphila TaxID=2044610 RepID=A0A2P5SYZ4_9GAMM|nr:2-oxoglutarate dehydrogenase complex dihydrolipoyllysine-residue succinyltransferase [Candidatus Pantoea edessiphila]MBK4775301.1 2-oxoglutarate dehydrogenase complex dihydrolipoyllysine-residue succinyltransferase [Pantoea sp. Edef]PPI87561.1 dihydrolipoyllysine-residue succinyltransferase [Candidatus Pantoea edessiphila]